MGLSRLWINLTVEAAIKELLHLLFSPKKPEPQQTQQQRQNFFKAGTCCFLIFLALIQRLFIVVFDF
jgi:hypothetical protein